MGRREPVDEVEEWGTQQLSCGVWELHFRLNPGGPDNSEYTTSLDRILEQGGLSDAWFAMYDEHTAARIIEQPVEHLALAMAAEQLSTWRSH